MKDGERIDGNFSTMVCAIADHLMQGEDRSTHVMIGPLVWRDDDQWYFVIGTNDRNGFMVTRIVVGKDERFGEQCRSAVHCEFLQRQPIVLHDFDDELEMAKWCERIWPSEETREIRSGIETERMMWQTHGSA